MGKINVANISAGLSKVKSITESLGNLSHFEMVPAKSITAADHNPYAKHDTSESLSELAQSIKTNGLIHPIVVNKVAFDIYKIISGERRFGAINNYLHWGNIPCMVYDNISMNAAELKLHAANLDVREYSTAEKFGFYKESERLLQSMKESGEYKGPLQKGIAELLGVSTRQIRKYQAIMKLPPEKQQAVTAGEISINDACKQPAPKTPHILPSDKESKSGTGSAFERNTNNKKHDKTKPKEKEYAGIQQHEDDIDRNYWDDKIIAAIKCAYNAYGLYYYYVFEVATPQEAINDKLGRGTFVSEFCNSETKGYFEGNNSYFKIYCGNQHISLTYAQIDRYIREMIRQGKLVSKEDINRLWTEKLK